MSCTKSFLEIETYECGSQEEMLTDEATEVINSLAHGSKNVSADTGVDQKTIDEWKEDPEFMAIINNKRRQFLEEVKNSFTVVQPKALFSRPPTKSIEDLVDGKYALGITVDVMHLTTAISEIEIDSYMEKYEKEFKNQLEKLGNLYKNKLRS